MGRVINAGKWIQQRLPVSPRSAEGLWAVTAGEAALGSLVGGAFQPSVFDPAAVNPVPIVVFCQDFPVVLRAKSLYLNVRRTDSGGNTDDYTNADYPPMQEPIYSLGRVNGGDWPNLITQPAGAIGAVGRGAQIVDRLTATNTVSINGYPIEINATDRLLLTTADEASQIDVLTVYFLCSSEIIWGFPEYNGQDTEPYGPDEGDFNSHLPVFLDEAVYTEAMREGDSDTDPNVVGINQYTDANGIILDILGVFHNPQ